MKAAVNRIIPFSSVDGPGNRTAVFLQGCNINCKYCHNPETRALCKNCGECIKQCPAGALKKDRSGNLIYLKEKCVQCDTCIHVCPWDSSPKTEQMTPEDVYEKVRKQIPFIRGLTVSGGECMLQPEFLEELFLLAKKDGLNTMIDSNGTIPFWEYETLLEVTDGVMLDIKAFKNEDHRYITDAGNDIVLKNAAYLAEKKKLYEVRAVIVPDLYDTTESVRRMGEFLQPYLKFGEFRIKLIAFRPMGVRKTYAHLKVPGQDYMNELGDILKAYGFKDIIII